MKYINIALLLAAIFCFFMPEDFHFHEDGPITSYEAKYGLITYTNNRNIEESIGIVSLFDPTYDYIEKNGFKTMYTYKWYSCFMLWLGVCLAFFAIRIVTSDNCSECPLYTVCQKPETITYKINKFFGK